MHEDWLDELSRLDAKGPDGRSSIEEARRVDLLSFWSVDLIAMSKQLREVADDYGWNTPGGGTNPDDEL